MLTLAERLTRLRGERSLTQTQLARLSGVRQGMISRIETGQSQSVKAVGKIAAALNVSVSWLQFGVLAPSDDGQRLVEIFELLGAADRARLLAIAEALEKISRKGLT